jgi:D-glycero-D-manno-heptose 1,7-bisphosphate phosphatase
MEKALFLDRDGVINTDFGYVHTVEKFEFIEGIFDLAKTAQDLGYKILIITNQAGIGRGFYTLSQFNALCDWMCSQFLSEGILITKIYHSPYHPTAGLGEYKRDHISRKPHSGMINQAIVDFNLEISKCVLIGDKESDMAAGVSAGVRENLLFTQNQTEFNDEGGAFTVISSLKEAESYLK